MKATSSSLHAFVSRVSASKRLNFGDLRRLQRDVLPDGPTSRADVEMLLAMDAILDRADAGWPGYLLAAIKDFVVATVDRPGGADACAWLAQALSSAAPKTALGVARAVVQARDDADDGLRAVAKMAPKRRPRAAACSTGLSSDKIVGASVPLHSECGTISFTWPGIRLGATALTARL